MKKFFSMMIAAVLCLSVAMAVVGCSEDKSASKTPTSVGAVYEIKKGDDNTEYAVLKQYTISDEAAAKVAKNNYQDLMVDLVGENKINVYVDGDKTYPVKEIAASAFANQLVIRSIEFGENVTTFGAACLSGCVNLEKLTVPFVGKSVDAVNDGKVLGYLFGTASVDGATSVTMSYNASGSKSFSIPDSLKEVTVTGTVLSEYAFYGLSLSKVNVENVQSIPNYAFYGMNEIVSYKIPAGVTSIGDYAFASCANLTKIDFTAAAALTTIGDHAFDGCSMLGYGKNNPVVFPASLTSLGEKAFYKCTELVAVDFSASGVTTINEYTFYGCAKLATATLKDGMEVKTGAFEGCDLLNA